MTRTIKLKRSFTALVIISALLNVFPVMFYMVKAMLCDTLIIEKFALVSSVLLAFLLSIIALCNRITFRSSLWLILLGLWLALDNIMTPLLIIAICQVVDELFITPIRKRCKAKLIVNKELDLRESQ